MNKIKISDITLRQNNATQLTFKEKLELVKLLDKLCVDVIETDNIKNLNVDSLCIKSFAKAVNDSVLSVPVMFECENIEACWTAVKEAKKARLKVLAPVSTVQLEYLYHTKTDGMLQMVISAVSCCRGYCDDVEFEALDATRATPSYLYEILNAAVSAGATTITVTDSAGNMLPDEYREFLNRILENVTISEGVTLGINCSRKLSSAEILCFTGAAIGAGEIKVSAHPEDCSSLENIIRILNEKGKEYNLDCGLKTVEFNRIISQIDKLFTETRSKTTPFEDGVRDDRIDNTFTSCDGQGIIDKEIYRLGYDLSPEDKAKVFDQFKIIASKKELVSSRELDAIVASTALQVPSTYRIEDYIINSGHSISATSHIILSRNGDRLEGVSIGDGAVDASFLAIEQITGHHYELDDFQIQAVTEGREAMGETIVKLRAGGKLYSGRGISTDIVGSSILAYINALNKIVYEEN